MSANAPVETAPREARPGGGEVPDQGWVPKSHALVVPAGTVIADPYRVEWVEGGITLEVVGEPRQRGTDATAVEADCVEVA